MLVFPGACGVSGTDHFQLWAVPISQPQVLTDATGVSTRPDGVVVTFEVTRDMPRFTVYDVTSGAQLGMFSYAELPVHGEATQVACLLHSL